MLDLDNSIMTSVINKYKGRFSPKYRAFNILQNKIEEVVKKSTQIWKVIYGLTTNKQSDQAPEEVGNDKDDQVAVETIIDVSIKYGHEEGTK